VLSSHAAAIMRSYVLAVLWVVASCLLYAWQIVERVFGG
jgi:HAMP domain-containing protein